MRSGLVLLVSFLFGCCFVYLHPQALKDLLTREFGSFAVFALVNLLLSPFILAQNEDLRPASALVLGEGAGGFRFPPWALL